MIAAAASLGSYGLLGWFEGRGRALIRCERGVTAIEFALLAPVFLTLLLGVFNIGQMAYVQSVLNGAVHAAARGSSLETADTEVADAAVRAAVEPIIPGAEFSFSRQSYFDFADIERPESFDDENNNDTCDDGEAYTDENRNGAWDEDVAVQGNGGAGDVVIYTVAVSYTPSFSLWFAPEAWTHATLTAKAVRKNQPFADQQEYSSQAGTCE